MPSELIERSRSKLAELSFEKAERLGLMRARDRYFLNISYPSLQAMTEIPPGIGPRAPGFSTKTLSPSAVYVHIPFCTAECYYCHYYKVFHKDPEIVDGFLDSLQQEMDLAVEWRGPIVARSVYIGGGTPSYLLPRQIERLFDIVWSHVKLVSGSEVSFEVHPESSDDRRLSVLANHGVTRVNLGVESLADGVLLAEHRRHTVAEALEAVERIRLYGFGTYNLDLIYGLRDQTVGLWNATLERLTELSPPSLTLYYLRLKRKTAEAAAFRREPRRYPSERDLLLMHVMNFERFEVELGYRQSPVDWYIKDDHHFHQYQEHNWSKSDEVPLVGFGPSAYSYIDGWQFYNINSLETYSEMLSRGDLPIWKGELLAGEEPMRRCLMLGLKTGIDREWFRNTFDRDVVAQFQDDLDKLTDAGVLVISPEAVELSYLGRLLADEVGQYFYSQTMRTRMAAIDSDLVSTTSPNLN